MFREIDGKLYNLMYAQSMNKVDEDDKYKIKYVIQNGRVLEEVFDSAEARDADFEDALEASMGGGASKKVIGNLEDLETTAKDNLVNAINEVYDEVMDHSLYRYIGTVHAYSDLPSSGMRIGYVYNIETADAQHGISAGDNVAWAGTEWDVLSGTVDLSGYQTKIDAQHKLNSDLVDDTNSTNKFTTAEEKTKLQGIEAGAQVNVQSDWNEDDTEDDAFIKNKPTNVSDFTNDAGYLVQSDVDALFFDGSETAWNELTQAEKESFIVATVEPNYVLTPEDISNINETIGVEQEIVTDMSESEALAITEEIIGGANE